MIFSMKLRLISLLAGALISSVCLAQAQGAATVINAAELKSQPYIDAAAVAELASGALIDILKSQGGWFMVRTLDGKEGWLRLLNVRPGQQEKLDLRKSFSQVGGVLRTGTTKQAATTGAKGLTREDIRKSSPNPADVARLDSARARPEDAEKFAATAGLATQDVAEE